MSEHRVTQEFRHCPRDPTHLKAQVTTEVINGKTVISKECAVCGQFISQTVLPIERLTRQ